MNFRILATLTALGCFLLAAIWAFAPAHLLSLWGVDFSSAAGITGRRNGALFLGLGVMFLYARNSEHSLARSAIISGFVVACLALAALGTYELATGHVGLGILPALLVEIALALAFLYVARTRK